MTTNKPNVQRYGDMGAEQICPVNNMYGSDDGEYVLYEDYEALQAEYEEELFCVRQTRDTHFGELMRALEQVDALQAECAILAEALELISDTDPDEGTAWFHEIANKALTTCRKGGCK